MSIIFADAWLITMNEQREVLESASVCVEKDRIVAVGTRQDLQRRFPTAEIVEAGSLARVAGRAGGLFIQFRGICA